MSLSSVQARVSEINVALQLISQPVPPSAEQAKASAAAFSKAIAEAAPAVPAPFSASALTKITTFAAATSAGTYQAEINASAARHGVDPLLVQAVIGKESRFDPNAESHAGAQGLMQLMPDTAAGYGVTDSFNPAQNIDAGTHFLSDMLKKYDGDLSLALAAYNAGPGNVAKYGGIPPFEETENYVEKVTESYNALKSASANSFPGVTR